MHLPPPLPPRSLSSRSLNPKLPAPASEWCFSCLEDDPYKNVALSKERAYLRSNFFYACSQCECPGHFKLCPHPPLRLLCRVPLLMLCPLLYHAGALIPDPAIRANCRTCIESPIATAQG